MIAVILCLSIASHSKDMTLLLSLAACVMVLIVAVNFLEPVVELVQTLETEGKLNSDLLERILKAVGVGVIGELASMICNDAGNSALGRVLEMLTASVILWLSIPLFQRLLELVQEMAGAV